MEANVSKKQETNDWTLVTYKKNKNNDSNKPKSMYETKGEYITFKKECKTKIY
jgi:hypothetical protein